MTGEIWEDIKGYEHLYQISNLGRVKSKAKHAGRSTRPERILKQSIDKDGYFRVSLCQNGKVRFLGVHRLMAEAFIPNPNHLPQVNHKNENKADNNLSNLEWCDCLYNINYGTRTSRATATRRETYMERLEP